LQGVGYVLSFFGYNLGREKGSEWGGQRLWSLTIASTRAWPLKSYAIGMP
jgi:hypothetical protein